MGRAEELALRWVVTDGRGGRLVDLDERATGGGELPEDTR